MPVSDDRRHVLQPVAAEEIEVAPPDLEEQREADREREELPHRRPQLVEGVRDLERHDEERDGEGEHRVAEALNTGDLAAMLGTGGGHARILSGDRVIE